MPRLLPLAFALLALPVAADAQASKAGQSIYINEVDSDTPSTDALEFVEFICLAGSDLTPYAVVFFSNSGTRTGSFDLAGTCPTDGFFVLGDPGVANVDQSGGGFGSPAAFTASSSQIRNTAFGVGLYVGTASDYPSGFVATTTNLIDAVVSGVNDSRVATTPSVLTRLSELNQFDEAFNGEGTTESVQRLNGIYGGPGFAFTSLFYTLPATPGVANASTLTVDLTPAIEGSIESGGDDTTPEANGYRQLSIPVRTATDGLFDVDDLADINLVQAVPGGTNPAQYPTFPGGTPSTPGNGDILFTDYDGNATGAFGEYVEASSTDETLAPGEGFFWYWYDADKTPNPTGFGGGTSVGYDLANPAFQFSLTGVPSDALASSGVPSVARTSDDGFYLIGNPYAYNYELGAITVDTGAIQTAFRVWQFTDPDDTTQIPSTGSFITLTADQQNPFAGDNLPVWNGAFAEVDFGTGPTPAGARTFSFPEGYANPRANDAFIGKTAAPASSEPRVRLALRGVTDSGHRTADLAPMIRFVEDAVAGWDRHDATKLVGPAYPRAILGLVGDKRGEPTAQDVVSLPADFSAPIEIPLDYATTASGQFSLSAEIVNLPDGWSVYAVHNETGESIDLASGTVEFRSGDTDGWVSEYTILVSSSAVSNEPGADRGVVLGDAFPNPSSDRTALSLRLAESENVRAAAYDALGREVAVLHDGAVAAGVAETLTLDTAELAAGVYVIRVEGESFVDSRRVTVVR